MNNTFDKIRSNANCHPFVKWAGGKTQLIGLLNQHLPKQFNHYIEPFLGGGALFFSLINNKRMLFKSSLSDNNKELINSYLVIKNNIDELTELLKEYEIQYKKDQEKFYYYLRDIKNVSDGVENAARFITLNKTCYNGLYRVNKSGWFNVPIGRYKNPKICDEVNLRKISQTLTKTDTIVFTDDYRNSININKVDENSFIYLDPPYDPINSTSSFTAYTKKGFGKSDQIELSLLFRKLSDRNCKVIMSNSDTSLVRQLYRAFDIVSVSTKRQINSVGTKRTNHQEVIIKNY